MDPYTILNVSRSATTAEIRSSWSKLVLKFHPDRNQGSVDAARRFRAVQTAYESLNDAAKRSEIDEKLKAGKSMAS